MAAADVTATSETITTLTIERIEKHMIGCGVEYKPEVVVISCQN